MPIRLQVIFNHISGLPRDQMTNTLWVDAAGGDIDAAEANGIAEAVVNFYKVPAATQTKALMSWLPRTITTDNHLVKVTPISLATGLDTRGPGFPPFHVEPFSLTGRVTDQDQVPSEVAVCLSFKNVSAGATPPARKRGRIYFPVGGDAMQLDGEITRPTQNLREDLVKAALKFKTDIAALGHEWVVFSRPYEGRGADEARRADGTFLPAIPARAGQNFPVTDVWVDNAFDTVRRRGERPTMRSMGS